MSPLEEDAVIDVCLGESIEEERARENGEEWAGNDNEQIHPEEMGDDERRDRRLVNVREADMLVKAAASVVRKARDASTLGNTVPLSVYEIALSALRIAQTRLDRAAELDGCWL